MSSSANEVVLNVKLPADLKAAFAEAVKSKDQNVSQVLREFMRKYVAQHGQRDLL